MKGAQEKESEGIAGPLDFLGSICVYISIYVYIEFFYHIKGVRKIKCDFICFHLIPILLNRFY